MSPSQTYFADFYDTKEWFSNLTAHTLKSSGTLAQSKQDKCWESVFLRTNRGSSDTGLPRATASKTAWPSQQRQSQVQTHSLESGSWPAADVEAPVVPTCAIRMLPRTTFITSKLNTVFIKGIRWGPWKDDLFPHSGWRHSNNSRILAAKTFTWEDWKLRALPQHYSVSYWKKNKVNLYTSKFTL